MKKIIPFKKELFLKNNIAEIVSISLEHTLHHERDYLVSGEFIITGDYKITDSSENIESFDFKVPFDINIDEKYVLDHMIIDIDDFYYEIINNNALIVNIEVLLDKLEEKEEKIIEERCIDDDQLNIKQEIIENTFKDNIFKDKIEEVTINNNIIGDKIEEGIINNNIVSDIVEESIIKNNIVTNNIEEKIDNASNKIEEAEEKIKKVKEKIKGYVTYRVCIVKEGDTTQKILDKYKIDKEVLEQYNDLNNIKVGDKIIIPSNE